MKSQKGIGSFAILLTLLIGGAAYIAGRQIFPFYYYYYEFLGQMEARARKASDETDEQIKTFLIQRAREMELPLANPESDISIYRQDNKIIIEAQYEEVFYVDFGKGYSWDLWYFKFHPRVELKY
ncbi:MAG: hypothetical protein IT292_11025 [Deltaproteobacteria bacterium]|nr:hypothetical protein [Deltaproteobacteria bacterium]